MRVLIGNKMCVGVVVIRKFETLVFNIKRDGDRHLRGKIAELIFEKVSSKLFRTLVENIVICSTSSVRQFLHGIKYCQGELWYKSAFYGGSFKLKDLVDMLPHYKDILKKESWEEIEFFRRKLGIKVLQVFFQPGHCVLCWRPLNGSERSWGICCGCYMAAKSKLEKKELKELEDVAKEITNEVSKAKLVGVFGDVLRVVSKLSVEDVLFLQEVYCGYLTGPTPFDYIGVAPDGSEKCLIDVTSTRSGSTAGLSLKERKVAELAKRHGFKILVPVIYFGDNWNVVIKIEEL